MSESEAVTVVWRTTQTADAGQAAVARAVQAAAAAVVDFVATRCACTAFAAATRCAALVLVTALAVVAAAGDFTTATVTDGRAAGLGEAGAVEWLATLLLNAALALGTATGSGAAAAVGAGYAARVVGRAGLWRAALAKETGVVRVGAAARDRTAAAIVECAATIGE